MFPTRPALIGIFSTLLLTSSGLPLRAQRPPKPPVTADRPQAIVRRVEQSLTQLKPGEGRWRVEGPIAISGRVFETAGTMNTRPGFFDDDQVGRGERVVFANTEGCDLLEVWVGFRGGKGKGINTFRILGDGEELYRSPKLAEPDPAIHVSVPIKGYSGISLAVEGRGASERDNAVWANPILVKLPPTLPATSTTFLFTASDLPKGRWRWRVHALSPTGFLGEMEAWRPFISE